MFPILLHIGPLTLHTYGLLVAVGFLAAYYVARKEFARRQYPSATLDQLLFLGLLSGLLGARIFYFALEVPADFVRDPLSFFRIWEGGLVFYGGFLFGLGALVVGARKGSGLDATRPDPFLALTDALLGPLLLGQAIGRLGCFAAGCCYGKPTLSFFHVTFTDPESLAPTFLPLCPTQLYEAVGNLALFFGWLLVRRRLLRPGLLTVYYLWGYGTLRFFIEFLRNDTRGPFILSLSPGQWISVGAVLWGSGLLLYGNKKGVKVGKGVRS
ncbi:MAG: prolipoprotein diacylglyceryl transferase [Elusimicrobia bacterium]|nr:prolipoprotein diacylglyceryl transferase [Candidatus Obscuribacterium magneticum]